MQLRRRGLTFDVDVSGPATGTPVLLLHGFPQNRRMWRDVVPRLHAAGLRTIAPDQRGYASSARPADTAAYRVTECADDAIALLDALDLPSAHLVGHDWGAAAAWFAAGRQPARVWTLTAVSVPHPAAYAEAFDGAIVQKLRSAYIGLFRQDGAAEAVLRALDGKALRLMFTGAGLDDARIDDYVAPLLEPGALTGALSWYRATPVDELRGLGPTDVPTTYVWSDGDAAIGRDAAERCAAHVTGAYRFVELTGVTHWIADQAPDALADAILDRVRDHRESGTGNAGRTGRAG
jgi:pimeloyl-ACP methyl ester carboxylesterase